MEIHGSLLAAFIVITLAVLYGIYTARTSTNKFCKTTPQLYGIMAAHSVVGFILWWATSIPASTIILWVSVLWLFNAVRWLYYRIENHKNGIPND